MRNRLFLLLPALIFLAFFFFLPLGRILAYSADFASLSAGQLRHAAAVTGFTAFQAALSTLLTVALGLPLAVFFARYRFPGHNALRVLTAVPFILPTVVVAAGFSALLGPRGWLNLLAMRLFSLPAPPLHFLGSLSAILTAHVFYNTTILIRLVGAALETLDPRLTQAARTLGDSPARAWLRVTLPLLRPAILTAAALVFLFDFTSYGVILLLGGPQFSTLEVEIALQTTQFLNLPLAALLSLIQIFFTLAFSALYGEQARRSLTPLRAVAAAPRRLTRREIPLVFAGSSLVLIFFALPLLALPLRSVTRLEAARGERVFAGPTFTLEYYRELFINRRDSLFYVPPLQAALNSLNFAAQTVIFSLALGFPAAKALTRPGQLARFLNPIFMLPLGVSAVTLGLGVLLAFSRPIFGWKLLNSPLLIPLAHSTLALPFVIRNLQTALALLPERYREAAAVLGASPWQVWWRVEFPLLTRALLSAAIFAFTISLGEFGAASLLTRPATPTLPTAIYRFLSQPGGLNYGQAMAMATLLMLLTGFSIALIEKLRVSEVF